MKLTHYIYISAALAMLAACHDDVDAVYTVGEEDNAIQLRADIVEGGAALTRASFTDTDARHATHVSLTPSTQIVWKADGQWKHGTEAARNVSQKSLATIGAASGNHNSVIDYSPVLFWDDYGTADPDNASEGRSAGLSIYAAAVDGKATLPTDLSGLKGADANWQALSWSVYDQTPSNGTMLDRDLIVAYNLKGDNAFKFEDFKKIKNGTASDAEKNAGLLEFRHMMSKVTINLKAGAGFPTASGASIPHFVATPDVQLGQGILANQTAYAYTSCTVNVETGVVTATTTDASKKIIVAEHDATATSGWSDTYHCLVVPGTPFTGTTNDIIAKIKADDNVYYVDGKAIRKAIYKYYYPSATDTEIEAGYVSTDGSVLTSVKNYLAQPGINYILKVIVNKTGIEVTATLVNWSDIEAGEVSPKINIATPYGDTSASKNISSFCLYRSASDVTSSTKVKNDMIGYSAGLATAEPHNYFPYETIVTKSGDGESATWSMSPQLYWPTHNTHYHFRGVAPATSTQTTDYGSAVASPAPHVEALSPSDATQIIKVWDAAFGADLFPSNLAIGKPIIAADTKCNNPDHDQVNLNDYGICATEGKINLEFAYMMSQVEVKLETEEGSKAVRLVDAQVEIINGYTEGYVTLGGREAKATGDKASHTMNVSDAENHIYKDAIVPQKLFEGESYTETEPNKSSDTRNLRFKITITNNDAVLYADADEYNSAKGYTSGDPGYCTDFSSLTEEQKTKYPASKDVYYADIAPIRKTVNGVLQSEWVVPVDNGKWESGKHYVYTLKLSKTGISVTATLVDWTTVYAEENVWF